MPFVVPAQVEEGGDAVEPLEKGARSRQHPHGGGRCAATWDNRGLPAAPPGRQVDVRLETAADVRTMGFRDRFRESGSEAFGWNAGEGLSPLEAGTGVQEVGEESDPKGREAVVERSLGYPLTVLGCWHLSQLPTFPGCDLQGGAMRPHPEYNGRTSWRTNIGNCDSNSIPEETAERLRYYGLSRRLHISQRSPLAISGALQEMPTTDRPRWRGPEKAHALGRNTATPPRPMATKGKAGP